MRLTWCPKAAWCRILFDLYRKRNFVHTSFGHTEKEAKDSFPTFSSKFLPKAKSESDNNWRTNLMVWRKDDNYGLYLPRKDKWLNMSWIKLRFFVLLWWKYLSRNQLQGSITTSKRLLCGYVDLPTLLSVQQNVSTLLDQEKGLKHKRIR